MGLLDQKRAAGTAAPAAAPAAGSARKHRYQGLGPSDGRSGFLDEAGTHDVEIVKTERIEVTAKDPWLKIEVKILESQTIKAGELRTCRRLLTSKAFVVTGPEILSMAMACMGFANTQLQDFYKSLEDETELPGVPGEDISYVLLDCIEGEPEACAEAGASGAVLFGKNPLKGMKCRVTVIPVPPLEGQTAKLSNYSWYPIPKA